MKHRRHLRTVRALAECYHALGRLAAPSLRELGYTPTQFDIIATLGNTDGMTFKTLGESTLHAKGTLTGVVDRLAAKGLVERCESGTDRRSTVVRLTALGEAEFERVFMPHVDYVGRAFRSFSASEREMLEGLLGQLREELERAGRSPENDE